MIWNNWNNIKWLFSNYCCCCLVAQLCLTPCDFLDCSTPGLPLPHHLLEFAQVHVCANSCPLSSHLIVCLPLFLLPSTFPSIRVFSNELAVCTGDQSWGMKDLVLWPGIELWPPALGVQNLNHWTTRRAPQLAFILKRQKIAVINNQWWTQCQRIDWVKDFCRANG